MRRFVPGPGVDQPIAMVAADGTKTFFHADRIGNVIAMTSSAGAVVKGPYTYDPYGNCMTGSQVCGRDDDVAYRYTGRRYDPETGLYYYRARYYSPSLGRFLQTDPVGYKDDINWYAYVGNDPTDKTDPTGMVAGVDDAVLIGGGLLVATTAVVYCEIAGWVKKWGQSRHNWRSSGLAFGGRPLGRGVARRWEALAICWRKRSPPSAQPPLVAARSASTKSWSRASRISAR